MKGMNKANMEMFKLQEQIKNNNADIQSAVSDLLDWSSNLNTQEKQGTNKPAQDKATQKKLPPIRNKIDIGESILAA